MPDNWINRRLLTSEDAIYDGDGNKLHDLIDLEVEGGNEVDAGVYPVLLSKLDKTVIYQKNFQDPNAGNNYYFGSSCATNDDSYFVGSSIADTGKVSVFKSSTGELLQDIVPSGSSSDDRVGSSCAVYGDYLFIGAKYNRNSNKSQAGKVYTYKYNTSTAIYDEIGSISDPIIAAGNNFGISCSASDGFLAVGASLYSNGGKVEIFELSGGVAVHTQTITEEGAAPYGQFGVGCALYGETLVVGDMNDDTQAGNNGKVYVYKRVDGVFIKQYEIFGTGTSSSAYFGKSCALYDNTLLVGSYGTTNARGSVYLFEREDVDSEFKQSGVITANGYGNSDYFGWGCSLYGSTVLVGAPQEDTTMSNAGMVEVFNYSTKLPSMTRPTGSPHPYKIIADATED